MRFLFALLVVLFATTAPPAKADVPTVAAAASLRNALDAAALAFKAETGMEIRPTYGSSGSLVQQITAGAPYQLFLSADESHVFRLADAGLTKDRGQAFAVGRLVLIARKGSKLTVDPKLVGLRRGLMDGNVKKLAIANPEVAPYGMRAEDALRAAGLWDLAKPRLVYGENIGQTLQFATTGGADGGFVSLSLVSGPGKSIRYALIPQEWHKPLTQRMVLLRSAGPAATRFHSWLLGPKGQALLARFGYTSARTR